MKIYKILPNDFILQNVESIEVIRNALYVIRFSDASSIDACYIEGNVYILSRDYKTEHDIAFLMGVLQINLLWYKLMLSLSQQNAQKRA